MGSESTSGRRRGAPRKAAARSSCSRGSVTTRTMRSAGGRARSQPADEEERGAKAGCSP